MAKPRVGMHLRDVDPGAWEQFQRIRDSSDPQDRLVGTLTRGVGKILERTQEVVAKEVKRRSPGPSPVEKPPVLAQNPKLGPPPPPKPLPIQTETPMASPFTGRSRFSFREGPSPNFGGNGGPDGGGFLGTIERGVDIAKDIKNLFGGGEGGRTPAAAKTTNVSRGSRSFAPQGCPPGKIKVGDRCFAPGDAFPGGDPFVTPAGREAVSGAFGMPAMTPVVEQRTHRKCPSGMVLGEDNLCYPRAILPRNSRFRKWNPGMKPLMTGGDRKAIRRAERVANKLNNEKKRLRKTKNALKKAL